MNPESASLKILLMIEDEASRRPRQPILRNERSGETARSPRSNVFQGRPCVGRPHPVRHSLRRVIRRCWGFFFHPLKCSVFPQDQSPFAVNHQNSKVNHAPFGP